MKNSAGREKCYPPRPKAEVDNNLRDLQNSSYPTKAEFFISYVRDGLPFCVRDDLYSTVNECSWIELSRNKCRPTLICCAYRAPDFDFKEFICNLEIVLEKINLDKCDFVQICRYDCIY